MSREELYAELIHFAAGDYLDTLTTEEMQALYNSMFVGQEV